MTNNSTHLEWQSKRPYWYIFYLDVWPDMYRDHIGIGNITFYAIALPRYTIMDDFNLRMLILNLKIKSFPVGFCVCLSFCRTQIIHLNTLSNHNMIVAAKMVKYMNMAYSNMLPFQILQSLIYFTISPTFR